MTAGLGSDSGSLPVDPTRVVGPLVGFVNVVIVGSRGGGGGGGAGTIGLFLLTLQE